MRIHVNVVFFILNVHLLRMEPSIFIFEGNIWHQFSYYLSTTQVLRAKYSVHHSINIKWHDLAWTNKIGHFLEAVRARVTWKPMLSPQKARGFTFFPTQSHAHSMNAHLLPIRNLLFKRLSNFVEKYILQYRHHSAHPGLIRLGVCNFSQDSQQYEDLSRSLLTLGTDMAQWCCSLGLARLKNSTKFTRQIEC